jgi:glycosyltransferase involved in cell wall biosynthesis
MTSTSPIRLVHCIGTMRLGGAEKQLAELICRLPRDRFEQSLVLLQGGGPLLDRVRASGCEVIELGYRQKFRKWDPRCYWTMARALWGFVRHLRRRRAQILHAQLFWANILGVVAGRLARVPVVITSRLQLSDYKFGRPMLQRIENAANRFTTAVFANSEAVRRDAIEHERIDPAIIRVIYNGVVLDDFHKADPDRLRREFALDDSALVVVAVANLHPYKGHDDLIRAVARLIDRHPNLRLLLPGRDQGARPGLEALVENLGVGDRVRLLGERSDIPDLMALADVVVHPSHQEGFSNAVLEGMMAGKPMVVTDVGGNPEAVRDGVNGYVVPPHDPETLGAAIGRLLDDPALRLRMGAASRERIEKEFAMDAMIRRFVDWYEELLESKRPAP